MSTTVVIPLSRGLIAVVDADEALRVIGAGPWHAHPDGQTMYARRTYRRQDGEQTTQLMHTLITGWSLVDHIDGDGLNNSRANLRPATHVQNCANRGPQSNNSTGYKGVALNRARGNYRAQIVVNGRQQYLGAYADPIDAARAYDVAARQAFGEFARLNFPDVTR